MDEETVEVGLAQEREKGWVADGTEGAAGACEAPFGERERNRIAEPEPALQALNGTAVLA